MGILSRVRLTNFGCFPEVSLDLAPLSVLVGPNDAGKTTLLHGILAHHVLATRADAHQEDVAAALGMPALLWHGAAPDARCEIELAGRDPVDFTATAHLAAHGGRWCLIQQDMHIGDARWSWHGHSSRIAINVDDEDGKGLGNGPWVMVDLDLDYAASSPWDQGFARDIDQLDASQQGWLPAFLQVREHIRNHRIFRLSPAALGAPSAPARSDVIPSLGSDGAGLPTLLSVLAGAERRRLDAIEDQLVAAVPTLAGFQILPTPEGHHRLAFTLKGSQTRIEASQMSDGVLLLLGYLSLLHHPRPPAVLLLEEPELGMHPRWLADIVRLLRTLTTAAPAEAAPARPATQVIVTTHAPALLDQVRPGEAFFLHRGADGAATATRFDAIHDIEERLQGSSLGALWTALGEDRLHELAHQPQPGRARAERAQTEPGLASHAGVPA